MGYKEDGGLLIKNQHAIYTPTIIVLGGSSISQDQDSIRNSDELNPKPYFLDSIVNGLDGSPAHSVTMLSVLQTQERRKRGLSGHMVVMHIKNKGGILTISCLDSMRENDIYKSAIKEFKQYCKQQLPRFNIVLIRFFMVCSQGYQLSVSDMHMKHCVFWHLT